MHCVACDRPIESPDIMEDLCFECRTIVRRLVGGPRKLSDIEELFGVTDEQYYRSDVISLEEYQEECEYSDDEEDDYE